MKGVSFDLLPKEKPALACAPHPEFASFKIKKIAVSRFADSSERKQDKYQPHAKFNAQPVPIYEYLAHDGDYAASAVESALLETYRYEVVERRELKKILKEQYLQHTGMVSAREAVALGKMAGADATLFGEVVDAPAKLIYKQEASGNFMGVHSAFVILKMRLVDVESGRVVWNCTIARNSQNYLDKPLNISNAALHRDVAAFSGPLRGATGVERIRSVLDSAAVEAVSQLR
jgi:curli biogenesis system outer membrane secretion channel CsgG